MFFLSLAEYGDEALRAAQAGPEMLPVLGGGSRDIDVVLWDMAQARHIEQSAAFAKTVESGLREHVPMNITPLQQAPLRVLVGANMPAVLVEMGFLSNPAQEKQLVADEFQNSLVQALIDGILRFRAAAGAGGTR